MRRALFAFVVFTSCAETRTTIMGVEAVDHSRLEAKTLRETLSALEALSSSAPLIAAEEYRQGSTFEQIFGFAFSGPRLLSWFTSRIQHIVLGSAWTVAVYSGEGAIVVREDFFTLPMIDRFAALIHEARHADGDGYKHIECPPSFGLEDKDACDDNPRGAYAYQAAFLFEVYARGLVDPVAARRGFRVAERRILRMP